MAEEWTVQKILNWTADFFKSKSIASSRIDAEMLLAHVLKVKRLDLYLRFDQKLADDVLGRYRELIKRRARNEPVAYIVGEREFYGRPFKVGSGVLIPRPETELIVDEVLREITSRTEEKRVVPPARAQGQTDVLVDPRGTAVVDADDDLLSATLDAYAEGGDETDPDSEAAPEKEALRRALERKKSTQPQTEPSSKKGWAKLGPKSSVSRQAHISNPWILDVGAGSGCLGITLALEIPGSNVTAVENHPAAAAIAKENARRLACGERYRLVEHDFENWTEFLADRKFDVVVSNPPYVGLQEKAALPADVKDFEPEQALYGGERGYELIARWIPLLARVLKPGGLLACEIGETQGSRLTALFSQSGLFKDIRLIQDYSGKPRIVRCFRAE